MSKFTHKLFQRLKQVLR